MNTRQVLKFRFDQPIDLINEGLNNYLKQEKFIQYVYNGENVLKWNSLFARQAFYKIYLKIHISENEITIIGWSTYKNVEHGFDEMLDLNNNQDTTKAECTRQLYKFLWAICSGLKNAGEVYCQKVSSNLAIFPDTQNLFQLNLTWSEKANVSVLPSIILDILSIPVMFFISSVIGTVMVAFAISRLYKIAEFKNQNTKVKIVFVLSILLAILYVIIIVIGISAPIINA